MAAEQDLASIERAKKLLHRTAHSHDRCDCPDCTALRRVCVLASEAVAMKEAKRRKGNAIR